MEKRLVLVLLVSGCLLTLVNWLIVMKGREGTGEWVLTETRSLKKAVTKEEFCLLNNNWIPTKSKLRVRDKVQNVAVGVVGATKYLHSRGRAVADTYAKEFQTLHFFTSTPEENVPDYIPNHITVPTSWNYVRSTWEEMNALATLYNMYPDSPWYLKVDDDTWINADQIDKLMSRFNSSEDHYLGHSWLWGTTPGTDYCAGNAYLLSNSLMRKIHGDLLKPFSDLHRWSDVRIGELTRIHGVHCRNMTRFVPLTLWETIDWAEVPARFRNGEWNLPNSILERFQAPLSIHWVEPRFMYYYHFFYHYLI